MKSPRIPEEILSWEEVRRLFNYDQDTGQFRWREPPANHRRIKAGDLVGTLDSFGYLRVQIKNRAFRLHRLAWKWVHGVWPIGEIDHIDTNRSNNALSNLRLATSNQNHWNTKISKRNTSGFKGVSFIFKYRKWQATIGYYGTRKNLGLFDNPQDAAAAYQIAATSLFGEFARAA